MKRNTINENVIMKKIMRKHLNLSKSAWGQHFTPDLSSLNHLIFEYSKHEVVETIKHKINLLLLKVFCQNNVSNYGIKS